MPNDFRTWNLGALFINELSLRVMIGSGVLMTGRRAPRARQQSKQAAKLLKMPKMDG